MKKIFILFISLMLLFLVPTQVEANGVSYRTFTYSPTQNRMIPTQDAYVPLSTSTKLDTETLNRPSDIYIDSYDNIFIADSGNKRILKYNLRTDEIKVIGDGILNDPRGVHVGFDNNLYVADFGNKKAYQFLYDENTNTYTLGVIYEKPVSGPYFSEGDPFEPTKIITDKGNNVYILLSGNSNGAAEYKNDGEFFGFFGGNRLPNTFENVIKSVFFDETQRRMWFKMIPKPIYNLALDQNGLVITITKGERGYKKLNIANIVYGKSIWGSDDLEDIFVGPNNTIFAISASGYIYEYTNEGGLLFGFSGPDTSGRKGLFQGPTGIAVDSKNNIYVLDGKTSSLQIFIPTVFAGLIHNAINYYQQGLYEQSKEPWQEVLRMNSAFDLANKGLGDAYYAEGNYKAAMHYYELSRDINGYSDAYWEVRNTALLSSASWLIYLLLFIIILVIVNKIVPFMKYVKAPFKKADAYLTRFKLYNELKFNFYVMKKPTDGYYGIKKEQKSSHLSSLILVMLFFISYLIYTYYTKFTFNPAIVAEIKITKLAIFIFVPLILWVIGNYLVCTIRDGEGTFTNVLHGTIYSLLPMTFTFLILTIISNFLTLNEAFIFDSIYYIGLGVTVFYLIYMVKEIHFYDVKPTIGNILLSIFTGLMLMVIVMIVYILLGEVVNLFLDIIKEVTSRG